MLIIFGGLPGTGKTSIAKSLARQLQAVYLRIDSIEKTIRNGDPALQEIGPIGYHIAYALAADNLSFGLTVIANPKKQLAEKLFSYGTLQQEEVQRATFGRKLIGVPDHLLTV